MTTKHKRPPTTPKERRQCQSAFDRTAPLDWQPGRGELVWLETPRIAHAQGFVIATFEPRWAVVLLEKAGRWYWRPYLYHELRPKKGPEKRRRGHALFCSTSHCQNPLRPEDPPLACWKCTSREAKQWTEPKPRTVNRTPIQ